MSADQQAATAQPPAQAPAVLEPEYDAGDTDSSMGDDIASSTASLRSSMLEYRKENGRSYHAYKAGKYVLPNDEEEMDRLDLQHHLFYLTFDNKHYLAPADENTPLLNVLDVGTGTGIWAIDFADTHPQSQVIGVDLSPIQPNFAPTNLSFQIDDVEEPWTFSTKFDFVYARMMTGSLLNWKAYFKQVYDHLTPGGYTEAADIIITVKSDDDSLPQDSPLKKWGDLMVAAITQMGRVLTSADQLAEDMADAGFVDIVQLRYKWPINKWPKDKYYKNLGLWTHTNIGGGLSGLSLALFTRALGYSREEMEVFLVDVRNDMKNSKIHAYFPVDVVYGRKPR